MKQIVLTIVLNALFIAYAYGQDSDSSPNLTQIRIKDNPDEILEYVGRIGEDFDTALDSLRKLKNINSDITKEPLEVIFDFDDRQFFGIAYGDCAMYSDVLDTFGHYYLRTWYSSDVKNLDDVNTQIANNFNGYSYRHRLFTILGHPINTPHKKGIFIFNGKKVMIK